MCEENGLRSVSNDADVKKTRQHHADGLKTEFFVLSFHTQVRI